MIYLTSDLHGYPLSRFMALLDKAGFSENDTLYVLGDVIDRNGDGGIGLLRWMMAQPNVHLLLGNHEEMLLRCEFLFREITDESLADLRDDDFAAFYHWQSNGARPTLEALRALRQSEPAAIPEILAYLWDAPLYEEIQVRGRHYILTHAGLGNYKPGKALEEYEPDDLLWFRPDCDTRYGTEATVVCGHTPTAALGEEYGKRMFRADTWMDIDTGASFGGAPMLLRLEDEQPFYADRE